MPSEVKLLFKICSYFSLMPFYDEYTRKFHVSYAYSFVFLAVVVGSYATEKFFRNPDLFTDWVLVVSMIYIILSNMLNVNQYQTIFDNCFAIDAYLLNGCGIRVPSLHHVRLTLGLNYLVAVVGAYLKIMKLGYCYLYANIAVITFSHVSLYLVLLRYVAARFGYLSRAIRRTALQKKRGVALVRSKNLLQAHGKACDSVECLNSLFGFYTFYYSLVSLGSLLQVLHQILVEQTDDKLLLVYNCLVCSLLLGLYVAIVAFCDKLAKEGRNCVTSSYQALNGYANDDEVSMKLFILAQQADTRAPKMSAFGFFDVNYAMLFGMANIFVTYLIAMIQIMQNKMKKWLSFNHFKSNIRDALEELNGLVDESDPDVDIPNIVHAFQTAERIRQDYPDMDWFHLTGLIHDLGKVMAFHDEPQWAVVGDTFVVGCDFGKSIVYRDTSFVNNKDAKNPKYNTKFGIYESNCGLDKLTMSWGHDEYLYRVLKHNKSTLPDEALYMIRYHSFYPWHSGGDYKHLTNEKDEAMKKWVLLFNQYDLYTKSAELPDIEKLWPYYESLIDKYIPGELEW